MPKDRKVLRITLAGNRTWSTSWARTRTWESINWRSQLLHVHWKKPGPGGSYKRPDLGVNFLMDKASSLIFVIDGLDVSAYASLEDLEFDIEPIDAKDHDFLIFDAQGRLVELSVDPGYVKASLVETVPTHRAELERSLRKFLEAINEPLATDPACDLPCLVAISSRLIKVTCRPENIFSKLWRKLTPK